MKIWYKKSAKYFEEALPIGNGSLGAMIYGDVNKEKISLNHDSFWSGFPFEITEKGMNDSFKLSRKLMDEGNFKKAQDVIDNNLINGTTNAYMAGSTLWIDFLSKGDVSNYKRELHLDTGIATITYDIDDNSIKRELFSSYIDNSIMMKITSTKNISCELSIESIHKSKLEVLDNKLLLQSRAPSYSAPNYFADCKNPIIYDNDEDNRTIRLYTSIEVICNGETKSLEDKISINNSSDITIIIKMVTSFIDYKTTPLQHLSDSMKEELKINSYDYDNVKENHVHDFSSKFNKSFLHIEGNDFDLLPTNERIIRQEKIHDDSNLVVLLWNFGKYLMLSSSTKGSKPANLQGIWNELPRPPWSSNYTTNINAQMNYWACEVTNLSDCHIPFLEFAKTINQTGKMTALSYYNCKGTCLHHNTDIWGYSKPAGSNAEHALWPMGFAWITQHVYEHYLYTLDKDFLLEYLKVIHDNTLFILDWIQEKNGLYTSYPSTSPENNYLLNNERLAITYDSAMDIALIKSSLSICLNTEEILGINVLTNKILPIIDKLPSYKVNKDGKLLEWKEDYKECDPLHRHISLLYDLFPGNGIKYSDVKLRNACIKVMEDRGDISTGWGIAWRINIWARLKDGKKALDTINGLLKFKDISLGNSYSEEGGLYANLFDAHPPFQIDGNFGYTAGVCEMLVQSQEGYIELLPALPKEWSNIEFRGFKARGGYTIGCRVENSVISNLSILFNSNSKVDIVYKDKCITISGKIDEEVILDSNLNIKFK